MTLEASGIGSCVEAEVEVMVYEGWWRYENESLQEFRVSEEEEEVVKRRNERMMVFI